MEQKHLTSNGATVFLDRNDSLHTFCLCLYMKAGCMYEKKKESGISHFFEHIVFRNIHFFRGQKLYQTLDCLGLTFNATTYNELIRFTICGAPEHFGEAAEILTQIFEPISLSEEEIDLERKRILAEIREEKEEKSIDYLGRKKTWKKTTLSRKITGDKKTLMKIRGTQLRTFQKNNLFKGSFFFYVTGHVPEQACEILSSFIERYPLKPYFPEKWANLAPVPLEFGKREPKVFVKKSRETEVFFGFDMDTSRYSMAEIDLLYDILFRGDYCRMYQELSERKGYVYSYEPGSEQYANIGQIKFVYEVQSKYLMESIKTVIDIFVNLKNGIGDALDYVKPNYIDNAYALLDEADDYNWVKAYEDKILCKSDKTIEQRIKSYQFVTPERMTQICQEIFRKENLVVVVKGNKKKISGDKLDRIINKLNNE